MRLACPKKGIGVASSKYSGVSVLVTYDAHPLGTIPAREEGIQLVYKGGVCFLLFSTAILQVLAINAVWWSPVRKQLPKRVCFGETLTAHLAVLELWLRVGEGSREGCQSSAK